MRDPAFIIRRNNVRVLGQGKRPVVFAHGFGCDQNVWRHVAPAFLNDYKVVLFDSVGAGGSDLTQFDPEKYDTLHGYAEDVLELCEAIAGPESIFVGHSVGAMVGILAAIRRPALFSRLALIAPSPSYFNDGNYAGGFDKSDIDELLGLLELNYLGWSSALAPVIMGNSSRPELARDLENSFCRTDPDIAKHLARTTFLSDHRGDLPRLTVPSLILQCSDDVIAPAAVGEYMHRTMPGSTLHMMKATGHCPHLSAPDETVNAIKPYLERSSSHGT